MSDMETRLAGLSAEYGAAVFLSGECRGPVHGLLLDHFQLQDVPMNFAHPVLAEAFRLEAFAALKGKQGAAPYFVNPGLTRRARFSLAGHCVRQRRDPGAQSGVAAAFARRFTEPPWL